jgi:hypothetical protein
LLFGSEGVYWILSDPVFMAGDVKKFDGVTTWFCFFSEGFEDRFWLLKFELVVMVVGILESGRTVAGYVDTGVLYPGYIIMGFE